jgi:hypothetical protein
LLATTRAAARVVKSTGTKKGQPSKAQQPPLVEKCLEVPGERFIRKSKIKMLLQHDRSVNYKGKALIRSSVLGKLLWQSQEAAVLSYR